MPLSNAGSGRGPITEDTVFDVSRACTGDRLTPGHISHGAVFMYNSSEDEVRTSGICA